MEAKILSPRADGVRSIQEKPSVQSTFRPQPLLLLLSCCANNCRWSIVRAVSGLGELQATLVESTSRGLLLSVATVVLSW